MHGVAEVPPVPSEPSQAAPTGPDVLRSLGVDALVEIIEQSSYGVCVTGDDHTWVYLNPAAEELVGMRHEDAYGRDYLESFLPHEREALLTLEGEQRQGDTSFYTNTVVRPDGTQHEMTWSGTVVATPLGEMAPAIFHDTSRIRRAQRAAAALARAAADLAGGGDAREVLDALAGAGVATTRAVACLLLVADDAVTGAGTGPVRVAGADDQGRGAAVDGVLGDLAWTLADVPGGAHLAQGRPVLLRDHRADLLEVAPGPTGRPGEAAGAGLVRALGTLAWRGSALLPVRCDGRLVGALVALLPPEVTSPAEEETEFWASLADQAGAALTQQRLRARVGAAAAAEERMRIGRDLHDSVSQDLFVIRQRAELLQRALDAGDANLLRAAATGLEEVARHAVTDLRALLAETRPGVAADLVATLQDQAARVTARHGLPVTVEVHPDASGAVRRLDPEATEHLARVVGEALHNCVKHAAATRADVAVAAADGVLVVRVTDDGQGMPPALAGNGHGMRTMRERMQLLGGDLQVTSTPGAGTRVDARLPLGRDDG